MDAVDGGGSGWGPDDVFGERDADKRCDDGEHEDDAGGARVEDG